MERQSLPMAKIIKFPLGRICTVNIKFVVHAWCILELEEYIDMCWVVGLSSLEKDGNHEWKR